MPKYTVERLATPLKYLHRARAEGRGHFPIDMLRYDGAHPRTERDAGIITDTLTPYAERRPGLLTVELQKYDWRGGIHDAWTPERWQSFGWTLTPIDPNVPEGI